MKSFWMPVLLIILFAFDISAVELGKEDVEQVLRDAHQGNPKAQTYLAGMYWKGIGVSLDHREAVKWWRKAAEQGHTFAQIQLGIMFSRGGEGVPQDYAEAMKWYREAAEQGDATAQNALGAMFYYGRGVPQDYLEAERWFEEAAAQGDENARKWLKAVARSRKHSEKLSKYLHAAEQGDAVIQTKLGDAYRYGGLGVAKDRAEAMKWYRMAVEQGNAQAATTLGDMFFQGDVDTRNYVESVKWYRQAAEMGSATGQEKLGHMYRYGLGVDKDLQEAKIWNRKAAAQGNLQARRFLDENGLRGRLGNALGELSETISLLLHLLVLFPVWWLVVGYVYGCSPVRQVGSVIVIFTGGFVVFFLTFVCGGGAAGSSEMTVKTWECLLAYTAIHNAVLALIVLSGKQEKTHNR